MGRPRFREMATNKERAPVMEAEQWKDRLAKEEVAYYHGREIRQRQTCTKVNDFSKRGSHRPPQTGSRPPTGVSSVCFDSGRSSAASNASRNTVHQMRSIAAAHKRWVQADSRGSRSSAGSRARTQAAARLSAVRIGGSERGFRN